jgi:carbamoylphosphate synthase small subunit
MMGYTQSVTDPSYAGQILCQTYPLIGNYGVCSREFESEHPRITGYAVYEACATPSHYTSETSLHEWLRSNGVPGIQGIDTRELTKTLRTEGTMLGVLEALNIMKEYPNSVVSMVTNVQSGSQGVKDLLKIEGKMLSHAEVRKVAEIAPQSTINVIKDFEVSRKIKLSKE